MKVLALCVHSPFRTVYPKHKEKIPEAYLKKETQPNIFFLPGTHNRKRHFKKGEKGNFFVFCSVPSIK
jgi:hypothetical protein